MRSSHAARTSAAPSNLLSKFLSLVCAVTLCCGLVPSAAFAANDDNSLSLIPEGEQGVASIASSAEGGDVDGFSHYASDDVSSADGSDAASTSEDVSDIEFINQDVELTTVVAQAESTKSFFLAQTLESTRTIPVVSANLPIKTEAVEESTVVGSFEYLGMTFAVEPGGESVALIAANYNKLPEVFIEKQVVVIPEVVTLDGVDYYSVTRIADNAFVSFRKENADPNYVGCEALFSDEELLAEAGIDSNEIKRYLATDDQADSGNEENAVNPLPGSAGIIIVSIPYSVTDITDDAFCGFDTLQYVILGDGNPNYASNGGVLFNADFTETIFVPKGYAETFIAPLGVSKANSDASTQSTSVYRSLADAGNATAVAFDKMIRSISSALLSEAIASSENIAMTLDVAERGSYAATPSEHVGVLLPNGGYMTDNSGGGPHEYFVAEITYGGWVLRDGGNFVDVVDVYGNYYGCIYIHRNEITLAGWEVGWGALLTEGPCNFVNGALVARWNIPMTLYANGGYWYGDPTWAGPLETTSVDGRAVSISAPIERPGYTLVGWSYGQYDTSGAWDIIAPNTPFALYAIWQKNSYTVSYWSRDGSTLIASDTGFLYDTPRDLKAYPLGNITPGYAGVCWADGPNNTGRAYGFGTSQSNLVTSGVKDLYLSETPINYGITYNLNGGQATGNPTAYTVETPSFTLSKPVRPPFVFAGWLGTGLDSPMESVTVSAGSIGDREYIATWKVSGTLNPNGGYWNSDATQIGTLSILADEGATYTVSTPVARTGYTLIGWSFDRNATSGVWEVTVPSEPFTLYAIWEEGALGINHGRIEGNGGTLWSSSLSDRFTALDCFDDLGQWVVTDSLSLRYGPRDGLMRDEVIAERDGYDLAGWRLGWGNLISPDSPVYYINGYIYAKWWIPLTLVPNGGMWQEDVTWVGPQTFNRSYYDGQTATPLEDLTGWTLTRPGYEFVGWSTSPEATVGENSFRVPNEATTYYACWRLRSYTVQLDPNAEDAVVDAESDSISAIYDEDVVLPWAKRPGWVFAGWNTEQDGTGTSYASGSHSEPPNLTSVTGEAVTLYAQWIEPTSVTVPLFVTLAVDPLYDEADVIVTDWENKNMGVSAEIRSTNSLPFAVRALECEVVNDFKGDLLVTDKGESSLSAGGLFLTVGLGDVASDPFLFDLGHTYSSYRAGSEDGYSFDDERMHAGSSEGYRIPLRFSLAYGPEKRGITDFSFAEGLEWNNASSTGTLARIFYTVETIR